MKPADLSKLHAQAVAAEDHARRVRIEIERQIAAVEAAQASDAVEAELDEIDDNGKVWVSSAIAARLVGASQASIRRWADAGRIECRRTSTGTRRYRRTSVEGAKVLRLTKCVMDS